MDVDIYDTSWYYKKHACIYHKPELCDELFHKFIHRCERSIWNQANVCLVANQSEIGKHNLILVWFNKIWKRFLCVCRLEWLQQWWDVQPSERWWWWRLSAWWHVEMMLSKKQQNSTFSKSFIIQKQYEESFWKFNTLIL